MRVAQALLLSLFLLLVQAGAFIHAVEHPFHAPDSACKVYLAGEHLGNGLPVTLPPPLPRPDTAGEFSVTIQSVAQPAGVYFRARAPPSPFHA